MSDSKKSSQLVRPDFTTPLSGEVLTTRFDKLLGWARKFSLYPYPFVTACCGMEYMSVSAGHYDLDRFGAAFPRFSPRQSDVLLVVGTVSHKLAPVMKTVYDQMAEPKWVVAFGACASCGGPYDNYATVQGIDTIVPVDIYIAGCPPRPEAVIDGVIKLQQLVQNSKQPWKTTDGPRHPDGLLPGDSNLASR